MLKPDCCFFWSSHQCGIGEEDASHAHLKCPLIIEGRSFDWTALTTHHVKYVKKTIKGLGNAAVKLNKTTLLKQDLKQQATIQALLKQQAACQQNPEVG